MCWATYCKAGRPTKFAHLGKWNRFAVKYLLRKCEMFAPRTWANFISHRARRDISQCALAHYFTFCLAKHFTYIYRPTIRFYKCNTLYLAGQGVWKGVRTNRPYPFFLLGGKTCFMVGVPFEALLFLCLVFLSFSFHFSKHIQLAYGKHIGKN